MNRPVSRGAWTRMPPGRRASNTVAVTGLVLGLILVATGVYGTSRGMPIVIGVMILYVLGAGLWSWRIYRAETNHRSKT